MKIFSGSSNYDFSQSVSKSMGIELSSIDIDKFKDGEVKISVLENVRGEDCFIIQSTCRSVIPFNNSDTCYPSVNDNIMEMFIIVDALKRGSANTVNLIIPYFGYQRQDRKDYSRAPISASVIARMIETLNVNRVMIFDLHAGQISGFFSNNCPIDNLYAEAYFIDYIQKEIKENVIFVAPDAGAIKTNYNVAHKFNAETCSIFKHRSNGVIDHMMLIGDVLNKTVIMIDDMIDTAGTICKASQLLKEKGARDIYVFATHGLFSGNALDNIQQSEITKVIVTNTVPNPEEVFSTGTKIHLIDVSHMCAEAISRLVKGKSISHLYKNYIINSSFSPINASS